MDNDILVPCPLDICDGSGVTGNDDGSDGAYESACPHTIPDDSHNDDDL